MDWKGGVLIASGVTVFTVAIVTTNENLHIPYVLFILLVAGQLAN
jgi:hypothetical protein